MVDSPDPVEFCYNLNRILLSMIGLWPHQTPRESWLRRSLLFLLMMSLVIPQFAGLAKVRYNLDDVIESLSILGAMGSCSIKAKDLLIRMRKDWENAISANEIKIIKRHAEESLRLTKIYAIIFYVGGNAFALGPVIGALSTARVDPLTNITRSFKQLPVVAEYGVDIETYFYPLWFHCYLTTITMMTIFASSDSMFFVYAQHGCTKFRLLKYRLSQVIQPGKLDCELHPMEVDDLAFHDIKICVELHKEAIKFADAIESTYSTCQLFQVGLCCLLISISSLHMVTKLNKPGEMVGYMTIVCGLLLQMLLYSWPSQNLMDQSLGVSEAVYSMEWYRVSIRSRKLLLQMMTRSIESCKITAGRLYVMSMENYSKILSSSYSYFTVLSTIKDQSAETN